VDGAVILLGNDGPPTDRVDRDGGVDNSVNRTGMAEVNAGMFLPPYHVSHCLVFIFFCHAHFHGLFSRLQELIVTFQSFPVTLYDPGLWILSHCMYYIMFCLHIV
jgi:hypothetical protein